jgi:hypothetical protein
VLHAAGSGVIPRLTVACATRSMNQDSNLTPETT